MASKDRKDPNYVWIGHGIVADSAKTNTLSGEAGYFDAARKKAVEAGYGAGCLVPVADWANAAAEDRAAALEARRTALRRQSVTRPDRIKQKG